MWYLLLFFVTLVTIVGVVVVPKLDEEGIGEYQIFELDK